MIKSSLPDEIIQNIEIRTANKKDIEGILKIEYDAFEKDIWEDSKTFLERINEFEEGFLIILYNKEIVGYISSEIWKYKENIRAEDFKIGHSIVDNHDINGDELYISAFGMLGKVRGMGIGNYIFDYFLNYISENFKNVKSIILVVSAEWKNAFKIYKNKGFNTITIFDDFFEYEDKERDNSAIAMRKKTI